MAHINVFDSLFFTPIMLSDFYFFCIHALIPLHPRVCPVYVLCMSGTHSVLSSSVKSYLRSNLTADSRTSLVPAILHFYFHFYYFHLQMFERFMNCIISFHMVCRLRYTASFTIHCVVYDTLRPAPNLSNICIIFYFFTPYLAFIPAPIQAFVFSLSSVYPVCTRHPFLSIIFGQILPSVISYRGF